MNIKIKYNNKENIIKDPKDYQDFIEQFKTIFGIEESLINSMNFYYIDEDNEENILSSDSDLDIFKQMVNDQEIVNCIYVKSNDKNCVVIEENKKNEEIIKNEKDEESKSKDDEEDIIIIGKKVEINKNDLIEIF